MDTAIRNQVARWLEREIALGLEVVPRVAQGVTLAAGQAERRVSGSGVDPAVPAGARPGAAPGAIVTGPAVSMTGFSSPTPQRTIADDILVEPAIRRAATLEQLRETLGDCRRCKLCSGRTNIVFGVGNPSARLMFVGEGPGEDEDLKGEPFVGKAGALLTDIITKGMRLRRDDVYIANVVKCRPPNNRNPEPDELVACDPFLRRQVEIIRPEVLVTLGNFATQALLGDRTPISRRRGRWHEAFGIALMPTFHPAYLLRNPSDKRLVWADIQMVMERLRLPLPSRGPA